MPVASCVSVWSILRAISFPGTRSPETMCDEISLYVRFMAAEYSGSPVRAQPRSPSRTHSDSVVFAEKPQAAIYAMLLSA